MIIKKGLSENHYTNASNLIIKAFNDKLIPILGNPQKAKKIIEASMNTDYCFSATSESELIGCIAFQIGEKNFLSFSLRNLVLIYGIWGGIKRAVKLSTLTHKTAKDEVYIEAIAVDEDFRGRGIGRKLINEVLEYGRKNNYKTLSLEVINTNPRAETLYKNIGFRVINTYSIKPLKKILNLQFDKVTYMEKKI